MTERVHYFTVPWFVELGGHRQVPGRSMTTTQVIAALCNRWPPLHYSQRVKLIMLQTGWPHEVCKYGVWMALKLGMVEWCDSGDLASTVREVTRGSGV